MAEASELYGREWREFDFAITFDAYLNRRTDRWDVRTPQVAELATFLGRTPASVLMRMQNFASIDPMVSGRRGLNRCGVRCKQFFQRWVDDQTGLRKCVELLRRDHDAAIPGLFSPTDISLPAAFNGKYELYDLIGEGGFAWVMQCIERSTGHPFAMKILKSDLVRDEDAFARFRREIRILRDIKHAGIIDIFDDNLDDEKDRPAFVMELGTNSLQQYIADRRDPDIEPSPSAVPPFVDRSIAVEIMRDILDAAQAMHSHCDRLIHRDISPQNILLRSNDRWILSDFGLAKFLKNPARLLTTSFTTASNQHGWGKDWYTAPEQWKSFRDVDERADIYAIGVLIWDLFSDEYRPIRRDKPGLPEPLDGVFLHAYEHERVDRYGSIAELRSEFEKAIGEVSNS